MRVSTTTLYRLYGAGDVSGNGTSWGSADAQEFDARSLFLVETFSWLTGESYNQRLVPVADMANWSFYDSAEWMRNTYESRPGRFRAMEDA